MRLIIALTDCIVTISENSFFAKFIIDRTSVTDPDPGSGVLSGSWITDPGSNP
jgi:hypothetical protein